MKRWFLVILVAGAVLGSLAWVLLPSAPSAPKIHTVTPAVATPSPPESVAPSPPDSQPAASSTVQERFPRSAQAAMDEISLLETQSLRGDKHASCELAVRFRHCAELSKLRSAAIKLEKEAARQAAGSDAERQRVERSAKLQERYSERAAFCEGVSTERSSAAWRYYQRSAEQGHLDAAMEFVISPPLDTRNMLRDIEAWGAYRNAYWPYLQRGIREGDARALFLAFGIAAGTDFIAGAPDDTTHQNDLLAASYGNALIPLLPESDARRIRAILDRVMSRLDPSQLQQAQKDAERLKQTAFSSNQLFDPRDAFSRALNPDDC